MTIISLKDYFPDGPRVNLLRSKSGANNARYTFYKEAPGYLNLYNYYLNQDKPGYHYLWKKEYWKDAAWCNRTNACLFMADDGQVVETGDWFASDGGCTPITVFGYKTALSGGVNTGLWWSPIGGLTETPGINEMWTCSQSAPGQPYATTGHKCYSKVGLIEHLDSYTVPYGYNEGGVWQAGSGLSFTDVVHLVMYHGTRAPGTVTPIRCEMTSPIAAHGPYYQSYKDFNTYAIELWLAAGVGIIQEDLPFVEQGASWGVTNCTGTLFTTPHAWAKFISLT